MICAPFLARLRQGLRGLGPAEIDEIITDYSAHFADAVAAGRSEADVAASLGDPLRLGRELRAEAKLRRWEARRSPANFLRAGSAMLPVFSLVMLLPVALGVLICAGLAGYVLYIVAGTGLHLLSGIGSGNGNILVPTLIGLGLLCGVAGVGALIALVLDSGLRLLGRHLLRRRDSGKEE